MEQITHSRRATYRVIARCPHCHQLYNVDMQVASGYSPIGYTNCPSCLEWAVLDLRGEFWPAELVIDDEEE
jgi:antirestriction protein